MKNSITAICIVLMAGIGGVCAKTPVRFMSNTTLGIEYSGFWRGQDITAAAVASHEQVHQFAFNYSPVEYVQVLVGLGMERLAIDEYNQVRFDGKYGFSFSGGTYLNTPAFLDDVIRITAGLDFFYLNCKDGYHFKYSGPVLDPMAGILLHAGPWFDIEIGAKGHFIAGTMENTETPVSSSFSNNNVIRGYLALSLASSVGAYVKFFGDVSPETKEDWKKGPNEATLGFSIGFILRQSMIPNSKKEGTEYFPEYENMKKKQDKMGEDLEE